jgi:hypothetical protein
LEGLKMTLATRDWRERNRWVADLLKERTGDGVEVWNERIREVGFGDEASLRAWLADRGVNGYPQSLLVMERFGYPAFLVASADELVDGQYRDRPQLRPILDAILARAAILGEVTVQARKTYVSLVTPKRTFAAVQPTTRRRVDLGLRFANQLPTGRLEPPASMGSNAVTLRIGLTTVEQVDDEVASWLRQAYHENV